MSYVESGVTWRTSTFSSTNGGGCVEVAFRPDGGVALRDTKDRSLRPHHYTEPAWAAFLAAVGAGEFRSPGHP